MSVKLDDAFVELMRERAGRDVRMGVDGRADGDEDALMLTLDELRRETATPTCRPGSSR